MKYNNYTRATQDASQFAARENRSYIVYSRFDNVKDEGYYQIFPVCPDLLITMEEGIIFNPKGEFTKYPR